MAHPQQQAFCESIKARFTYYFSGVMVLDIGSLDINGNNQVLFDADSLSRHRRSLPWPECRHCMPAHELGLPDTTFGSRMLIQPLPAGFDIVAQQDKTHRDAMAQYQLAS